MQKQENDESSLQCSMPGCTDRWSVNIGRPLCSYHQWGKSPIKTEQRDITQEDIANIHDKRFWAKKILRDEKIGIKRPLAVLEMAKTAMKVHVQSRED